MAKKADDERWLEGRTRHVRVYLTDDEHTLVRRAAALADRSVSRFSVEAIVATASHTIAESKPAAVEEVSRSPDGTLKPSRPRKPTDAPPVEEPAPAKKGRRKKRGE